MSTVQLKRSFLAGVSAFLFGAGGATTAIAQNNGDDSAGDRDEIIVVGRSFRDPSDSTATKLGVPLSETAGQVLVLTEDFNDALGNISVLDTLTFIPGVTNAGNPGNGFFLLARGFGLSSSNAFRINGAPLGADILFDQAAVSRFEYIKGAQAASYGQISAAGFINLGLKEANGEEAEGNVQVRVDNFAGVRAEMTYGGPLNDEGTVRLLGAIAREQSDTRYDNFGSSYRSNSAYVNLAVDITDRLTSKIYGYFDQRREPLTTGAPAGLDQTDPLNPLLVLDYIDTDDYYNPFTRNDSEAYFFQTFNQYEFENGDTLSGSFSYTKGEQDRRWATPEAFIGGYDDFPNFTPGAADFAEWDEWIFFRDQIDVKTRYAEIRYTGNVDITDNANFNYVISGEHYFNEALGKDVDSDFGALPDSFSLINEPSYTGSDPFNVAPETLFFFQETNARINSISFLFSLDLYERLRINGGIRHDDYKGQDGISDPADTETFERGTQSYSASIAYDVLDSVTAYYAYSDGFEFVNALSCDGSVTPPEENRSHEVGVKWEPNSGLLGSIAVFDNNAINALDFVPCPVGSPNPQGAVLGEAAQEARGVELELVGSITPEWSFGGGLSYVDDKRNGFANPTTPEYSLNFFTTYDFPDSSQFSKFSVGGGLRASFGRGLDVLTGGLQDSFLAANLVSFNGLPIAEVFDADGEFRADRLDDDIIDHVLVDLLVSYDISDNLQFRVNARNLFNEYHLQDVGIRTSGIVPGEPRTIFGTVDFSF